MEQKSVANVHPQIVSVSFLYKTTQKKLLITLFTEDTVIFAMIFLDRVLGKKRKIK